MVSSVNLGVTQLSFLPPVLLPTLAPLAMPTPLTAQTVALFDVHDKVTILDAVPDVVLAGTAVNEIIVMGIMTGV